MELNPIEAKSMMIFWVVSFSAVGLPAPRQGVTTARELQLHSLIVWRPSVRRDLGVWANRARPTSKSFCRRFNCWIQNH
jgi:hypothetical protein